MLRFVLLGLLEAEPRYGYELKAVFEQFLGGTWQLNIGQIYTTLGKLEAEGLVAAQVVPQDSSPDRKVYEITDAGRAALSDWATTVEGGPVRLREELFLKVAVLSLSDSGRARTLIHEQRTAHLATLAGLADLQAGAPHPATELLLEAAMLRLEADLRWLDLAEDRLKEWPA
ncbi:MAG TPA: PadR family transcriptional regulator [Acidimicrobiales bacterium]|nr:PadR family transcriptional regulator [Acidimicrobiales bacterium]